MNSAWGFYVIILLNSIFLLTTSCQESIDTIDFSDGNTTYLTYGRDFLPKIQKPLSENKNCYIARYENQLFIASVSYSLGVDTIDVRHIDSLGNTAWLYRFDKFIEEVLVFDGLD